MHKKSFSALFAVTMLFLILPLFPTIISLSQSGQNDKALENISLKANTQTSTILGAGYVASGLFSVVPDAGVQQNTVANSDPAIDTVVHPATSLAPPDITLVRMASVQMTSPLNEALEVAHSADVININPGKAITYWVDFKNVGTTTWYSRGSTNVLSLKLASPTNRTSLFQHPFWKSSTEPARMLTTRVRPGEVGRFRMALQAPTTVGVYSESFQLVTNGSTPITGGKITLNIGIGAKAIPAPHWRAEETARSFSGTIKLKPGVGYTFWIDFTNTGSVPWFSTGNNYLAANLTNPVGRTSSFQTATWFNAYQPAKQMQKFIRPGETARFRFAIKAPQTTGQYLESLQLVANNLIWIDGGSFTIPIQVGDPQAIAPAVQLTGEPTVRIGITTATAPVTVTADGSYQIWDGTATLLSTKPAGTITTVTSKDGTFTVASGDTWTVANPPRFIPVAADTIMQVPSYTNKPSWNSTLNDNTFRGAIEIRYAPSTTATWIINELPLESYLRGMAESTNGQPAEYLKTLAVAERSYALWHYLAGGKHTAEGFTLNATSDQVYRGYGFEARSIGPLAAVRQTAGIVIAHPDAVTAKNPQGIAFAPYSSGTDGRTRSWSEVWSGSYAWLVSVDDPYGIISNALTLSGNHMVGLSAQGARGYAQNGLSYDKILSHYYTGIIVKQAY